MQNGEEIESVESSVPITEKDVIQRFDKLIPNTPYVIYIWVIYRGRTGRPVVRRFVTSTVCLN